MNTMKSVTATKWDYMVISIFIGLLFCCFPNKIFAQEPVEVPQIIANKTQIATRSDNNKNRTSSYLSVQKTPSVHTDSTKMGQHNGRLVARKVIRDFVLYNYAHLADNIINGKGMYLATLYGLMGIAKEEKESCQRRFLHVLLENKRIPDFSNCIAGYDQKD